MDNLKLQLSNSLLRILQFKPGMSDIPHKHQDECQISILLYGPAQVEYNNRVYPLTMERRLVTQPDVFHRHFAEQTSSRVLLISLKEAFLENVLRDHLQNECPALEFIPWADGSSENLCKMAEAMIRQALQNPLGLIDLEEQETELASLLLSLQPGSHSEAWRSQKHLHHSLPLQKVLEIIHDAYDEELCLDQLAAAAGLSKFHLLRSFRNATGLTPCQYLGQVRLDRAKWLLEHTKMDVTDIALDAGFGSLSSFHRAFKKAMGVSASEYRKHL